MTQTFLKAKKKKPIKPIKKKMKIKIIDEETQKETLYEFPFVGEGNEIRFPFLVEPKIGGRRVKIAEMDSHQAIEEIFGKTIDADPDFRAYFFAEVFCQMLSYKAFNEYYREHVTVNFAIDAEGRYFKVLVEFSEKGNLQPLTQDESDLNIGVIK